MEPTDAARRLVDLAADHQGEDILMLDLRGKATFADYFVICSGINERHLNALAEAMNEGLTRAGVPLLRIEGPADSGWVLLDFGDVIVHLFSAAVREQYSLEQLWRGATPVLRLQ